MTDVGASFPHRVTLHPTCHSLRMLHVGDRPRRLLSAVRGIDLVELEDADECCGFGGTFAVKNAETSMAMLGDKLRRVLDTRAEVCTAADNSCLMHIGGALRRQRAGVRTMHLAEILAAHRMRRAFRRLRTRRCRTRSCGATSARRRRRSAPSGCGRSASCRTGRRCATPARRSRRARWRRCPSSSSGWRRRWSAPAGSCTGRATARRRTRSSPASRSSHGAREVVKVKSIATDEIGLNDALAAQGISAIETDLAELILQLSNDKTSHILVPAIHRNRMEIKALFERTITDEKLGTEASAIAEAARRHLRAKFLSVPVAVSGANFGVAETGTVAVVESEGNGRMCTTLPKVLVTVMGIEKVLPEWRDLEVFLQLLPRSSTAERMNPYTSLWTGVRPGDGPEEFHLVLLDGGRTDVLADEVGPPGAALHPLLGVPERVPGLLARRRAGVRVGLSRADRRGALAAAVRARRAPDAAVGVVAVRRLLRRLPGQDRDPVAARAPARARDPRAEVEALARGAGDEDRRRRVRLAGALRARAEARAARPRADRQGRAAGLDRDARAARAAEADVPGVVA